MPRSGPLDRDLPELAPLPQPSGWFEVFCCLSIMLVFGAVLAFFALYH